MNSIKQTNITKGYLYTGLFFTLLILLCCVSPEATLYLRYIAQFVAPGRSSYKLLLGLVWIAAICFILCTSLKCFRIKYTSMVVLTLATILGLLNFSAHYLFSHKYGLSLVTSNVVFHNNTLSTNSIAHTHVMKPVLTLLLKFVGKTQVSNADSGYAFYNLLPTEFYLFSAFIVIGLIISFIVLLIQQKETQKYMPLLIVASYSLIRVLIDGGIFAGEFFATVASFIFLYQVSKSNKQRDVLIFLAISIIIFLIYILLLQLLSLPSTMRLIVQYSKTSLFFLVIIIAQLLALRSSFSRVVLLLLLVGALYSTSLYSYWAKDYDKISTKVSKDDKIVFLDTKKRGLSYEKMYEDSFSSVYAITVKKPGKLFDYYKLFSIPPSYGLFNIANVSCRMDVGFKQAVKIRLIEPKTMIIKNDTTSLFRTEVSRCMATETCDYHIVFDVKGCVPNDALVIYGNYIRSIGLKSFILEMEEPH